MGWMPQPKDKDWLNGYKIIFYWYLKFILFLFFSKSLRNMNQYHGPMKSKDEQGRIICVE